MEWISTPGRARTLLSARPNLLDARYDHDSCGTGFVAHLSGEASHRIVRLGLTALSRLAHRGAVAADGKSSDGVGVMTAIPREYLLAQTGLDLPRETRLGVGMFFLARGADLGREQTLLDGALGLQGLRAVHWRDVPVRPEVLGESAVESMPRIVQAFIVCDPQPEIPAAHMETRLYLARQAYVRAKGLAYACSLSADKLTYKGLCAGRLLADFYPDLRDAGYKSPFLIFHQRYATNVMPAWERAQPLRMLAHNGEINTIGSNRSRMAARDASLPDVCKPVLSPGGSDSTSLDEVAELLTRNGRTVAEALRMLLPPGNDGGSTFVKYHSEIVEPWDGPAAFAFADGPVVGAALDRNGLRPCRYTVTTEGLVVAGSEAGLVDIDPAQIAEQGRLGPGEMIAVDLKQHTLLRNSRLLHDFDQGGDYGLLLDDQPFRPLAHDGDSATVKSLTALHSGYGYSREDVTLTLTPMAREGKEAVWSMGDDTPIAALSHTARPVYDYFRQRFAQVTNPAIDPLREACVFNLQTRLGPWPHLLYKALPLPGITLPAPLLTLAQMTALRRGTFPHAGDLPVKIMRCYMKADETLQQALADTVQDCMFAVQSGFKLLLLTDRAMPESATPLPMALATGAIHHALTVSGLRTQVGIAVEAADAWDTHHIAVLLGYGAGAICPWLALSTAREMSPDGGEQRYLGSITAGLAKIMSKAGISDVDSYRSAELFDVLGLADEVCALCFPNSAGLRSGTGFALLEEQTRARWSSRSSAAVLPDLGLVRFRKSDGAERHAWQPLTVRALQGAVGSTKQQAAQASANGTAGASPPSSASSGSGRDDGENGDDERRDMARNGHASAEGWQVYTSSLTNTRPAFLRELLGFTQRQPIALDEVEPATSICGRFLASAMSLGSLSPEAHQAITDGMNLLGARSNTGEGGEDRNLYRPDKAHRRDSRVKQVASGRFGVTAEYLAHAEELEIKISQGSKPGEGGQLPGHKVTGLIARLRYAQPGSALISPPPHHDIYSIEDLAQLIYDLKRVNPRATVGVKLVSSRGVGTVAAGVAKAYADFVVIAGHSGGTGASPLSSIKHAGNPWELGLAEAQQVLIANDFRHRVRVRVDGGLRDARDVVVAALLGAEEFAFGTAVLVALGCDMARQCHLNTCPTGIATQREDLRAKFRGRPEHIVRWFTSLAEDVRVELARLGFRTLQEAVGRTDLLTQVRHDGGLELGALLGAAAVPGARCTQARNDRPHDPGEDHDPPDDAWLAPALAAAKDGVAYRADTVLRNSDRAIGARLAGELSLLHLLSPPELHFVCTGTAGQSFGAFAVAGMHLELTGQANDYVGKGLSGGILALRPPSSIAGESHRHVILGNVALYGATSGALFAAGRGGERFAVRNSGATAVIEGLGDHGCEYMTGGAVAVLGPTGINFGAGMTGGEAFVFDEDGSFTTRARYDSGSVRAAHLANEDDVATAALRLLLQRHVDATGSRRALVLLENWPASLPQFVHVRPHGMAETQIAAPPRIAMGELDISLATA